MNIDKENADFIKKSVQENIALPESLSKENIEKLVSGKKQKASKKAVIRRFTAIGVAACIAVAATAVLRDGKLFGLPVVLQNENAEVIEDSSKPDDDLSSYEGIVSRIRAYAAELEEEKLQYKDDFYYVVDEEAAVDFVADAEGSVTFNSAASAAGAVSDSSSSSRGELNLRVDGVYEDDIFINDGEYLYYTDSDMEINIVKAEKDGSLTGQAVIKSEYPEIGYYNIAGLYRYENYLIACYTQQEYADKENYGIRDFSGAVIYDVSDKSAPKEVKTITLDGWYSSSRIVDGRLILISTHDITKYYSCTDDELLLPCVYNGEEKTVLPEDRIIYSEEESPESYVIVSTLELSDLEKDANTVSFLGHSSDTYCTRETLYILGTEYTYRYAVRGGLSRAFTGITEADTIITAVDISGDTAEYICNTKLDGTVLNSYSIDEYEGYLRIALTRENENCITVLDKNLQKAGELSGIAPGEQIKSARFMGNTAYLVTFVQTDPLFVIDLSDPEKPEIKGEVKLPGFSSYLHPAGDGLLVGIGYGGTEDGLDGSAKISLFDVKDPVSPKEIDSFVLENAQFEVTPKAYTKVSESSFLIPYYIWQNMSGGFSDGRYRSGALYMEVADNKLQLKMDYFALSPFGTSRATFIDNNVYIYETMTGVASFNMESGEFIDSVESAEKNIYGYKTP